MGGGSTDPYFGYAFSNDWLNTVPLLITFAQLIDLHHVEKALVMLDINSKLQLKKGESLHSSAGLHRHIFDEAFPHASSSLNCPILCRVLLSSPLRRRRRAQCSRRIAMTAIVLCELEKAVRRWATRHLFGFSRGHRLPLHAIIGRTQLAHREAESDNYM